MDDMDFYDEEEPEISQNLALLQSICMVHVGCNDLSTKSKEYYKTSVVTYIVMTRLDSTRTRNYASREYQ